MLGRLVSATGVLVLTWLATLTATQSPVPSLPPVGEFLGQVGQQLSTISQQWYVQPAELFQQTYSDTLQSLSPTPSPVATIEPSGVIATEDGERQYIIQQTLLQPVIEKTLEKETKTVTEDERDLEDILPDSGLGGIVYKTDDGWETSTTLYHGGDSLGFGTSNPEALLHILAITAAEVPLKIQARADQTAHLTEWLNSDGDVVASMGKEGVLRIETDVVGNLIELVPTGDTGSLSSSGGAFYIDNSQNPGAGFLIFSNAGAEAEGNLVNIKTNNSAFSQASIYVEHRGSSNGVEITHNGSDSSSNALSVTNNNIFDSAVGIIGFEKDRGTVKISHNGSVTTPNASGLSIDVKGEGTAAQGIYVDSTAATGTTGKLLRLRNQSIDRFTVDSTGTTTIGTAGTNTTFKKIGNVTGDEFFVGTNGAFRVSRSATDSEAFRVQVNGDTQGRWLGTSDGKLKWGSGTATQDVILQRSAANTLSLTGLMVMNSPTANADALSLVSATNGNQFFRIVETSGSSGWVDINDSAGASRIRFRGDNGNNYFNVTGNFGIGTNVFNGTATRTISLGAGTAPSAAISNAIQLYATESTDDGHVGTSAELYVMDEAGNATNLSPHNFSVVPGGPSEDMAWAYYSERGNLVVNADMMKAMRLLERYSGEQLVYIKDRETGSYQEWSSDAAEHSVTEQQLAEQLREYVSLTRWERVFLESANEVSVLQKVVFTAAAKFTAPVQFLAKVRFGGPIEVSAQTAGEVVIPAGATKVAMVFATSYSEPPRVWITPQGQLQGSVWVENVTSAGFEVVLQQAQANELRLNWLALVGGTESGTVVVESAVVATPEPTPTATSTPQATPQPSAEPSVLDSKPASGSAESVVGDESIDQMIIRSSLE